MLRLRHASLLVLGAMALTAEGAPRGRVVRVERGAVKTVPRFCVMGGGDRNMCFGEPREGDHITIFDLGERRVRGEFVIESSSESTELAAIGLCVNTGIRNVKGSYTPGTEEGGHVMGMRGLQLNRRIARVLENVPSPSGRTDDSVELAVDYDDNGQPDLVMTQYSCDVNGSPSAGGDGRCFDTYTEQRGGLRRVQQDIIRRCP
jgi:hypothetical protein